LEAMACKKPVIGTNVGGVPFLIDNNKNGLLVPPRDPQALADAIIKILENPKLAKEMGENGYKKVSQGFTWGMQAAKTINVYRNLKDIRKQVIVTTSWDDGHKLDLKLAKLLKKYNIKGTFYVSPNNREFKKEDLLTDKEIIELSKDFEIGAHTMTHPRLTKVSKEEAQKEIVDSKKYLEQLTGKEIKSFCYPGGDYNKEVKDLVKEAGFNVARTTKQFITSFPKDLFELDTTLQSQPQHINYLCRCAIKDNIRLLPFLFTKDWEKIAKRMFDYVLKNGGVYHLWAHSWVIDKLKDWDKFERVFEYISNRQNVKYLTNSEIVGELIK